MPAEHETQIGEEALLEINKAYEENPALSEKVQEFYNELNLGEANNIQVIDAPFFNAFALPNHTILITTTALENLQSYEELAALLAHEYTHNAEHHVLKGLLTEGSRMMFFEMLMGNQTEDDLTVIVNKLSSLKNSREFELEADGKGLELLCSKRIDASAMVQLINTMKEMEPKDQDFKVGKYFRTHPHTDDRIKALKQQLSHLKQDPERKPVLEALFQKIHSNSNIFEDVQAPSGEFMPEEEKPAEPIISEDQTGNEENIPDSLPY